mgnify:CR=1 FL=1
MALDQAKPHSRQPMDDDLEDRVSAALADPEFDGHPLREILEQVMERMSAHVLRLERITLISDRYQSGVQERFRNLSRRYDRQINRLEKAIRISDRYQSSLNDLNRALQEASTHDQLTGLPNRKLMADCCRREDERVIRDDTTYSMLAIDADRFKLINDTYGHEVGDKVLIALADSFQQSIREGDYCARWGGEEFLIVCPDTSSDSAAVLAERLAAALRRSTFPKVGRVTASFGVAGALPDEGIREVISRADKALYEAKHAGRDRVVTAASAGPVAS